MDFPPSKSLSQSAIKNRYIGNFMYMSFRAHPFMNPVSETFELELE
jgi:hypothetical protein